MESVCVFLIAAFASGSAYSEKNYGAVTLWPAES